MGRPRVEAGPMKITNAIRCLPPYALCLLGFLAVTAFGFARLVALLRDAGVWHG